jgi:hypothetical protein
MGLEDADEDDNGFKGLSFDDDEIEEQDYSGEDDEDDNA